MGSLPPGGGFFCFKAESADRRRGWDLGGWLVRLLRVSGCASRAPVLGVRPEPARVAQGWVGWGEVGCFGTGLPPRCWGSRAGAQIATYRRLGHLHVQAVSHEKVPKATTLQGARSGGELTLGLEEGRPVGFVLEAETRRVGLLALGEA